jgi:hypothetical protein
MLLATLFAKGTARRFHVWWEANVKQSFTSESVSTISHFYSENEIGSEISYLKENIQGCIQ